MRLQPQSLVLTLLLFEFVLIPQALARDDWQYWNEFELKAHLIQKMHLRIVGEQRLRDDFSDLFVANVEAGLLFEPVQYLEFGPVYKFESEKSLEGVRTNENRLILEATAKYSFWKLELSDRNQVEYRTISGHESRAT